MFIWKNRFRSGALICREPVGTAGEVIAHFEQELCCPVCNRWTLQYGRYSQRNEEGTESYQCDECGERIWNEAPLNEEEPSSC